MPVGRPKKEAGLPETSLARFNLHDVDVTNRIVRGGLKGNAQEIGSQAAGMQGVCGRS